MIFTSKLKFYQWQQILSRIFLQAIGYLHFFSKKMSNAQVWICWLVSWVKMHVPWKIWLVQFMLRPAAKALFILSQWARGPPSPSHRIGKDRGTQRSRFKTIIFNVYLGFILSDRGGVCVKWQPQVHGGEGYNSFVWGQSLDLCQGVAGRSHRRSLCTLGASVSTGKKGNGT